MPFGGIRDYFSRRVPHDVIVHGTEDFSITEPETKTSRRLVETKPFAVDMNILPPKVSSLRGVRKCGARGFVFSAVQVKTRGNKVRLFRAEKFKVSGARIKFDDGKVKVKNGMSVMLALPQERENRVRWHEPDSRGTGESILAWYGPIVEDAVVKMALNKGHGTLLIWYNPKSRKFRTGGVCVCRKFGAGERPELRWDKNFL